MKGKIVNFLLLVAFITLFFISCDQITEPDTVPDPTDPLTYELIWSDEFDQNSRDLDMNNWNFETGYGENGWGNDEWQNYTSDSTNVHIENGNLVISAQCPSGVPGKRDGSVTSARINTKDKFSFKYGKVQARIKPPATNGMWPAFWMLGANFDDIGWPQCGEIDIMEMSPLLFGENTTLCTVHWWDDDSESHTSFGENLQFVSPLTDDFHIFEVVWDEQRIVGKIDDIPYFVKVIDPVTMSEFLNDFFLILNIAVGGNMGGAPDESTVWPQQMRVDWIRVYQPESDEEDIETFGIFTDLTPVDAGLTVGLDAEIYVWEETLSGVPYTPYEGDNVISFLSTGLGWFGAGISSNLPLDLGEFEAGNMKFMMKIPANVTFKIGINDVQGHENYVEFPANQTVYGYERNGEWGQVTIPISDITGDVNLQALDYPFMILEEGGAQCHFVIDDIYWDGGGTTVSSVNFDADVYNENELDATITVADEAAANSVVSVAVDNGTDTINIDVTLDVNGSGTATVNFGPTNDGTDTIVIADGDVLTATYTDAASITRTDTANIEGVVESSVSFDANSYDVTATSATVSIVDEGAANSTVNVEIENGTDTINLDVNLDGNGNGSTTLNFGPTNDGTDTIVIADGVTLTASYTDYNDELRTDTAIIEDGSGSGYVFGVFTDTTPVDEGIIVGEDANIWVWENTLSGGSIPAYEGDNVISWQSTGAGWFGAGIQSNNTLDLSAYSNGNIKLMIKMPADVTFKIGITDDLGNENYVEFPANTTAFGLERNGEWGQAVIPISTIQGSVNLQNISYVLTILEENGAQCEFALDDIYWEQ